MHGSATTATPMPTRGGDSAGELSDRDAAVLAALPVDLDDPEELEQWREAHGILSSSTELILILSRLLAKGLATKTPERHLYRPSSFGVEVLAARKRRRRGRRGSSTAAASG